MVQRWKPNIFRASVWGDEEHRVSVPVCPDCFAALHDANFFRVGTSGARLPYMDCSICRVRQKRQKRSPSWFGNERERGVTELHQALMAAEDQETSGE